MNPSRPHLFGLLAGLFLSSGLVFASFVVAGAWSRIAECQVINVTGSAHKNVRSDLVVWHANFSVDAPTLLAAQEKLRDDFDKVGTFLRAQSFGDFTASPPQIEELTAKQHNKFDDTTVSVRIGYQLTQTIEVRCDDAERVIQLVRNSGDLLRQNVAFTSEGLVFIYTKAGDAKVEMMAEATKDARARAEQIASQGGRRVKELRSARMGVVQINPLYSGATSAEGNNDMSARDKTITATVSATFSLD